jgi:hypothetical protein
MFDLEGYLQRLARAKDDLALRQRPSRFSFALSDSIAHLCAADWDAVVGPARVLLGRAYLGALERARPPRMSFRYALVYDGTRPIAAAAYQLLEIALDAFGSRAEAPVAAREPESLRGALRELGRSVGRSVVRQVGEAIGDNAAERLLINGNGLSTGEHGFAIADGVDPGEAIHALADATYRIRRAEKLRGTIGSVLVKDFPASSRAHADELLRFGYHAFEVDPNMVVEIDPAWRGLDDYLGAFTAKYRRKAKDARKKARKLKPRRLSTEEVVRHATALHSLYLSVHDKAKFRLANPGPDYFPAMAEALGDDFVLRVWCLDDHIAGLSAALGGTEDLEAHMVGLDYEHNVEHGVYQNALYDFVADAIARRARRLHMGRTALEIKSSIGAVPRPMTCYMRHANPLGNRLIAPLVAQIVPDEWTPRSPFKDEGQGEA